jgi:alpha-1,3-glucan synthase
MGDLIAFDGSVNASAGFRWDEYDYVWKTIDRRYHDFHPGNERNKSCEYPRIWGQDGYLIGDDVKQYMDGCRDSEFDAVMRRSLGVVTG